MSLCDDTLLCNFPKCRTKLSGFAWVTACSHVFCDQHGSLELSRSPVSCPACSSALSGKLDVVRTELSPSEEHKAMVLAGLRPDLVLDISARALAFWNYQVQQERMYQEYSLSRAQAQLKQMEKVLSQQNQRKDLELHAMRGEIASLKKVMEEYKRKYSEVSERLMERNRQYQKLQGLYDSLRLRNMAAVGGERDAQPQPHDYNSGGVTMRDIHQAPGCHPGAAAAAQAAPTPRRSPHFPFASPQAHGRFFSCLEADGANTFFQSCSPSRDRGGAFVMKKKN